MTFATIRCDVTASSDEAIKLQACSIRLPVSFDRCGAYHLILVTVSGLSISTLSTKIFGFK